MNSTANKYLADETPVALQGFERMKHDIRNLKVMTNEKITIMLSLTPEEKNELLLLYNEVLRQMQIFIEDL